MTRIKILPPKPDKELMITFRYTPLAIKEKQDSDKEDRTERVAQALEEYKKQQNNRKRSRNGSPNLPSGSNSNSASVSASTSPSIRIEENGEDNKTHEQQTNGNGNGHGGKPDEEDPLKKEDDATNELQDNDLEEDEEKILSQKTSPIEAEYFSNLDKDLYPFSSKYTPQNYETVSMNGEKTNQIINIDSLLLHQLGDYMQIDSKTESKWEDESRQVIESLRNWRRLYKVLDFRKRQLKKAQNHSTSSSSNGQQFKDKESSDEAGQHNLNHSSNDSSNGNEESEDVSSDNNNLKTPKRSIKKRKISGSQGLEITMNGGSPTIDTRKKRSTRSGR